MNQRIALIESSMADQPRHVRLHYRRMVDAGESPIFAEMAAMQMAPVMKGSDRAFGEGARRRMDGMWGPNKKAYLELAKKAGISTQGKYYMGYGRPTDPAAWVSTVEDVKDVCRARNYTATGLVNIEGREPPPRKQVRLAKDIVDRYVGEVLASEPATAEKVKKRPALRKEIEERVIEKHGARKR